jgi:hypothetical protein
VGETLVDRTNGSPAAALPRCRVSLRLPGFEFLPVLDDGSEIIERSILMAIRISRHF